MIEITCEQCGLKSNNSHAFDDLRFGCARIGETESEVYPVMFFHLCSKCIEKLEAIRLKAEVDFLKFKHRGIKTFKGVI